MRSGTIQEDMWGETGLDRLESLGSIHASDCRLRRCEVTQERGTTPFVRLSRVWGAADGVCRRLGVVLLLLRLVRQHTHPCNHQLCSRRTRCVGARCVVEALQNTQ